MAQICSVERARKAATENSEGGFAAAVEEGDGEEVLGFFLAGGWEAR